MKKTLFALLLSILIVFPGCVCNPQPVLEEEELPATEVQGPTTPPYSVGPSGPPPGE